VHAAYGSRGGGRRTAPRHPAGEQPPTSLLLRSAATRLFGALERTGRTQSADNTRLLLDAEPRPCGRRPTRFQLYGTRLRPGAQRLQPLPQSRAKPYRASLAKPLLFGATGPTAPLRRFALRRSQPRPGMHGRARLRLPLVQRNGPPDGARSVRSDRAFPMGRDPTCLGLGGDASPGERRR